MRPAALILIPLLLPACLDDDTYRVPEPVLWPDPSPPLPEATFLTDSPWLLDLSTWSAPGCGPRQPREPRSMGDFGVGNGHVFTLTGYTCPLNTLHTMVGPDYQQEEAFFKDTWLHLGDGAPDLVEAHVYRVRRTAIVVSRERFEGVDLTTVTFAPLGAGAADPVHRAVVRIAAVTNTSDSTIDDVTLHTEEGTTVREGRHRTLVLLEPAGAANPAAVSLGSLAPGEEKVAVFAYVMSIGGDGESETIAALQAMSADDLLANTRDRWFAFVERAARLDAPDPRVVDLLEGMLITVRAQQTYLGGVSPMSRYTLMWIRDTAGAVRFFLRAGLFEEARAMLDYYHLAAVMSGDIANALHLDHDPPSPPPEPDWASMPLFQGRTEGETPSYLPLMARWYAQATGDASLVDQQLEFLLRALIAQNVSPEGLIPFSGDETYRGAMSMAMGWDIEHDYVTCCRSANSSFLFAAAADALAVELDTRGEDASDLRGKASLVRTGLEAFWHDGAWAPFVELADPNLLPPVFEDVSTKPLWTGFAGPEDDRSRENLDRVLALLGREDGFLQSPLDERYRNYLGFEVEEGVYTGMMPGYFLTNLAVTDHPFAQNVFNALELAASPSGNFGEYQAYDDHSALQFLYDPGGTIGDMTARYRPWEGGVCLDAMIYYLTGLDPDASAGVVGLAPRLPNDWPEMRWTNLRFRDARFELYVQERDGDRRIVVTPTTGDVLRVWLDVPLPPASIERVEVRGERVEDFDLWEPYGRTRVRTGVWETTAEDPLEVRVVYERLP